MDEASRLWLADVTVQLDECSVCAAEEGPHPPSETAIARSRDLLQAFSACIASQPDIYPMDLGSVAIDFRTPGGRNGVLFVVDQDGSGVMFYRTSRMRGRKRVDDANQFIEEGVIAELKRMEIR